MTDPRRDVADEWPKPLHEEVAFIADDAMLNPHERAVLHRAAALLPSEGREPDAWYIEEPSAGMIPWFTRDATAAEQYRTAIYGDGERFKVTPVYFGTPSTEGREPDLRPFVPHHAQEAARITAEAFGLSEHQRETAANVIGREMQRLVGTPSDSPTPTLDECDYGHRYARLPDHPVGTDGRGRCPHCLAEGLDRCRASDSPAGEHRATPCGKCGDFRIVEDEHGLSCAILVAAHLATLSPQPSQRRARGRGA